MLLSFADSLDSLEVAVSKALWSAECSDKGEGGRGGEEQGWGQEFSALDRTTQENDTWPDFWFCQPVTQLWAGSILVLHQVWPSITSP